MVGLSGNIYIPKYIRIAKEIEELINSGMDAGEKIYSEKEIMEKYGVSSTTARKSLEVLRYGNIIERIQGKGTFVSDKKVFRSLRKIISFTENMKNLNIVPSAKVLSTKIISGYTKLHKKLKLSPGDRILELRRVKLGDGIPLVIDNRYISLKYCPDLYLKDLSASLYELYELYNIKIVHSKQYLELSFINKRDAKLLNCRESDPIIHIEGLYSLEDYTPVEYEKSFWDGQKCGFNFETSL
jgi:GntR family transcriptional regulator